MILLGRFSVLPLKPIFDTNVFGDIQDGKIPESDWRFLLRHRPGHGWPLSPVTALELLAGVHKVPSEKFSRVRGQAELVYKLSKGRVLEDAHFLLCKEVLHVPFLLAHLRPALITDYMDVVRCARSLEEIRERRVFVRRLLTKGNGPGHAGFNASVVKKLVAGPKRQWSNATEMFASEVYPQWREHFQTTGKRLPDEMRSGVESRLAWGPGKAKFVEAKLAWLGASTEPGLVAEITKRLDAVLEFATFVVRQFLLGNYNLEKHESDVYDNFQLHYLAFERFVIVSGDSDLSKRTLTSHQAGRIMSFESFLRSL